jgi:hypothetical protein
VVSRVEASAELVRHLSYALAALSSQLNAPSDHHLVRLETEIDSMLLIHRHIASHLSSDGEPESFNQHEAGQFFRVMVTFCSVLSLATPKLKTAAGARWGSHLFGTSEFRMIGYSTFAVPKKAVGVRRLLDDQATDLVEAATELADSSPLSGSVYGLISSIEDSIDEICRKFGSHRSPRLDLETWSADETADRLGLSIQALNALIKNSEILSVISWSGEVKFPIFQFDGGAVKPVFVNLARNVADSFSGWRLAVWAQQHKDEPDDFFKTRLTKLGLWKAAWAEPATGDLDRVRGNLATVPAGSPLFRIVRSANSPFYFSSSSQGDAPAAAPMEPTPPAGRFDLHRSTQHGTLYLAETARGAWREVLDREPVVTLHDIITRTSWTLTPKQDHKVSDVTTGSVDVSGSNNRLDTQHLAQRLQPRFAGIRYRLRSTIDDFGLALFGAAGARQPSVAGIGFWDSDPSGALDDDGLWEYLSKRDTSDAPVLLRRFPHEIEVKGVLPAPTATPRRWWQRAPSHRP